ncbi:MAG: phospholipid carrier-dependent glycosyltransferase [Actinomycetota bacterium]|nr:phospholipid carrier-dependent glycosyltransferase [Actinomycetota bacterium]MDH5313242.1 phospholipid carrier-dependent glycosyltransferase [Actinomycetota bacterium]
MPALLRRLNRPAVAVLAVAAVAGIIRFAAIDDPHEMVFDEVYYAKAGCVQVTGGSDRTCMIASSDERFWRENEWDTGSWVHPPLGKLTIGLGVEAFSMSSFGWRFASALAGIGVAVFTALMAQLLFGRPVWTFAAGLLIAIDGLNVVQSRVALLDIHLAFWATLGFLFLLLDRRWIDRRTDIALVTPVAAADDGSEPTDAEPPKVPSPFFRPWRFAAGAALGAAVAVKWSGAMAIPAAVLLTYLWETTRRRRGGVSRGTAFARTLGLETIGVVVAFAIVPLVVYTLTWIPWFVHFEPSLASWIDHHRDMWNYHRGLRATALDTKTDTFTPTHGYYSKPWTWIPMLRPVSYFVEDLGPDIRQILAIGNPVLFWGTMWTVPFCAWAWWRKRDWAPGFSVVAFGALFLPWFAVQRPQFFFYALPLTPFMALAAVYTLRDLAAAYLVIRDRDTGEISVEPDTGEPAISRRKPYLPFVWGYFAAAVGLFLWMWPILTAGRISDTMWKARVWFRGWT